MRLTFRELWLDHKDEEVWHDPAGNGRDTYNGPYITEFDCEYTMEEISKLNAKQAK